MTKLRNYRNAMTKPKGFELNAMTKPKGFELNAMTKPRNFSECNDKTKDLRFCLRGKYTVGNSTILKEVLRTLMELSYIIYRSV